ncbi:MAG: hypothetical protein K2F85_03880, partial [Helicobacter sp.]|nr:hypothetical protein [Helicobacter sp.]
MKLLLINSNPIVSKLIKLSADKVNIDVLESESLDGIDLNGIGLVFVDDKSLRKDLAETLAQKLPNAKLGLIYSKNSKKENGFTLYVQKPFLPTDFVELLKNETIGMDKKTFASPEAGAATTAVAQEAISVEDATAIPDDMLQESLGKGDDMDEEESDDLIPSADAGESAEPVEEESENFDPDNLPEAPEGSTEGLEGIEGLDSDVGSLLGGDDEDEKSPFADEEELDLEDDSLDGLDRPKKSKEPEPEPESEPEAAEAESDELDLGEDLDLGDMEAEDAEDSEPAAAEASEPEAESDELDLDLGDLDADTCTDADSAEQPAEKEGGLDED